MTNLQRPLKKLEAQLTDSSALVPYSPQWFEYWDEQMHFTLTGGGKTRKVVPRGTCSRSQVCRAEFSFIGQHDPSVI